ncbi:MAG: hypothetical protein AB8B36_09785 [Prochlorococcus sp.]
MPAVAQSHLAESSQEHQSHLDPVHLGKDENLVSDDLFLLIDSAPLAKRLQRIGIFTRFKPSAALVNQALYEHQVVV